MRRGEWTAKDLAAAVRLNSIGESNAEIGLALDRTGKQVREALQRYRLRTGAETTTATAVAAAERRAAIRAEAERLAARRESLSLKEIAAVVGCEAKTVRRDLASLGLTYRFERAHQTRLKTMCRAAGVARYELQRIESLRSGYPPVTAGQRLWLSALAAAARPLDRTAWALSAGRSRSHFSNMESAPHQLIRAGYVTVDRTRRRRPVYAVAPAVAESVAAASRRAA